MLEIRQLLPEDEQSFRSAVQEFSRETPPWEFAFDYDPAEEFNLYIDRVNSWPQGVKGFVPSSYFVAITDGKIVGRVSIRHELNNFLKEYGGHVGYGIVPSERRKGYATEILRQSIELCRGLEIESIMISCDFDNDGSKKVIERNGGIFEKVTDLDHVEVQKLIFWIDTNRKQNQSR